jgi:hypothetical protein
VTLSLFVTLLIIYFHWSELLPIRLITFLVILSVPQSSTTEIAGNLSGKALKILPLPTQVGMTTITCLTTISRFTKLFHNLRYIPETLINVTSLNFDGESSSDPPFVAFSLSIHHCCANKGQ